VYANSVEDVQLIENSVIKESLKGVSKYYTINTDFTMKVVDRKVAEKTMLSYIATYLVITFVAIGLVAGIFALVYMLGILRLQDEYDENINGKKIFANYHSDNKHLQHENKQNEIVANEDDVDNIIEIEKKYEDTIKTESAIEIDEDILVDDVATVNEQNEFIDEYETDTQKTSSTITSSVPEGLPTTPSNLPVIDLGDFGFNDEIKSEESTQETNETAEPTEEELKARLNELLDGKL